MESGGHITSDLKIILRKKLKLIGKKLRATQFGKMKDKLRLNAEINNAVREVSRNRAVRFVELDELIESDAEALSAHHFQRPVYHRMAMAISATLGDESSFSGERPSADKSVLNVFQRASASSHAAPLGANLLPSR